MRALVGRSHGLSCHGWYGAIGFHMFGFFICAVATAAVSLLLKRSRVRALSDETIHLAPKLWEKGLHYVLGSLLFGLGWGLLDACPSPIYALIGSGITVMFVALASALDGTWIYGWLRPRLLH
jgi:hypothetical protein